MGTKIVMHLWIAALVLTIGLAFGPLWALIPVALMAAVMVAVA